MGPAAFEDRLASGPFIEQVRSAPADPVVMRGNWLRAYYYRLQDEAIMAYGGYECACCGEAEPLYLSIDHVNNDGAQHRKELGSLGGHKLYKWLKRMQVDRA